MRAKRGHRAGSGYSAKTVVLSLLITAAILMLAHSAQAQRQMAATHIVRPGETLGLIAKNYGVDINALARANGISNAHFIYSWQELQIPSVGGQQAALPSARGAHIVRRGETLDSIAKLYGIALSDLMALNKVYGWLYPGDKLALPVPGQSAPASASQPAASAGANQTAPATAPASPASQPATHVIQPGETLFRIALRYGISVEALLQANGIEDPRYIHAGNVLHIGGKAPVADQTPAPQPAPAAAPNPAPPDPSRKHYLVQRGDSLSDIGARLNMSWQAIADVNGITNPNALHAGVSLMLPTLEEMARYSPANSNARTFYFGAPSHPGPRVGVGREIVVQLSTQTAYAYENGVLQKRALISSGRAKTPTIEGDFKVYYKVRSQTMDGPGYYLENVEWVMYFKWEYALHGTYWHYNFGEPMSHGCVNMTNADAKWFYEFASIGTPVHVRYR